MRALVCGDRNWTNVAAIRQRLQQLPADTIIIEGEARGADRAAAEAARQLGLSVLRFPADWGRYGKAAGARRNREMLDANPDLVIAFHPDLSRSKGTADMVRIARKAGVPVEVHHA